MRLARVSDNELLCSQLVPQEMVMLPVINHGQQHLEVNHGVNKMVHKKTKECCLTCCISPYWHKQQKTYNAFIGNRINNIKVAGTFLGLKQLSVQHRVDALPESLACKTRSGVCPCNMLVKYYIGRCLCRSQVFNLQPKPEWPCGQRYIITAA